jgi:hypothetical protein
MRPRGDNNSDFGRREWVQRVEHWTGQVIVADQRARAQKDEIDCELLAKHGTDDTMIGKTQVTTRATAAAARNTRAMVKGPDKTHTKWKCRTKGDVGAAPPSGPSSARISQMGRRPDPEPTNNGSSRSRSSSSSGSSRNSSKGESWHAEGGIEKIHMKLWKCRIGGCNKTFHRKGDAVRHLQTTARHNGKAVVCNCGAPFSRHDALKRHQRLCSGRTS